MAHPTGTLLKGSVSPACVGSKQPYSTLLPSPKRYNNRYEEEVMGRSRANVGGFIFPNVRWIKRLLACRRTLRISLRVQRQRDAPLRRRYFRKTRFKGKQLARRCGILRRPNPFYSAYPDIR